MTVMNMVHSFKNGMPLKKLAYYDWQPCYQNYVYFFVPPKLILSSKKERQNHETKKVSYDSTISSKYHA